MLKLGARGNDVQRLQRLLNIHLDNDEQLKVDGIFGPKTRTAVLEFQKEEDVKPDAIVGRDTWFCLVSAGTQEASWKAKPPAPPTKVVASSSTTATKKTVDQWALTERFEYVLQHCAPYLGPDMRAQFTALLTPVNLGIMVGSLVVWAAGHFFGVSEIADAFLLGFGLVFLGKAAIDAARLLKNVIEITCSASTEVELEDAAKDLAEAIAIIGVMTFFALLAKVGRAIGNKLKAAKEVPVSERGGGSDQPGTTGGKKVLTKPDQQGGDTSNTKGEDDEPTEPEQNAQPKEDDYVNNNPKATPDEIRIGKLLNGKAKSGELPGVVKVEGAAEVPGARSADYRFTDSVGNVTSADLYQPESGNPRSIASNIIEKSGQADTVVVELGKGKSAQISDQAAQEMAKSVVDTPGHSIDRVIVIRNSEIVCDVSRQ
jgi:peptidoglycan hydrolase-like protein with peptidoglycan-binding domain